METQPQENLIIEKSYRELLADRHNAFLEMDIDSLEALAGEAESRARTFEPGSEELGQYQALALGIRSDIERFYTGE